MRHGTWNPHRPVRWSLAPYAIIIKVFIAHGSGSYVARGEGSILTLVAHCTPAVKAVIGRRFGRGVGHRVSIGEANLLVRMNTNSRSLTGGVSFTFAHCDDAGIPIRIDVKAVVA